MTNATPPKPIEWAETEPERTVAWALWVAQPQPSSPGFKPEPKWATIRVATTADLVRGIGALSADEKAAAREALGGVREAESDWDAVAALAGCPRWDYPGQVVRDVRALRDRAEKAESALAAMTAERDEARRRGDEWIRQAAARGTELDAERASRAEMRAFVELVARSGSYGGTGPHIRDEAQRMLASLDALPAAGEAGASKPTRLVCTCGASACCAGVGHRYDCELVRAWNGVVCSTAAATGKEAK